MIARSIQEFNPNAGAASSMPAAGSTSTADKHIPAIAFKTTLINNFYSNLSGVISQSKNHTDILFFPER